MSRKLARYFRHGLFPQLMVFEAVARLGGVTRAGEELHLAQSTVSTQLKKLSQALGVTLYEPNGRGLRLTPAGRALAAACGELIALVERTESSLGVFREGFLREALQRELRNAAVLSLPIQQDTHGHETRNDE
jgi:DNA-binding transcriptional LysR family regulator